MAAAKSKSKKTTKSTAAAVKRGAATKPKAAPKKSATPKSKSKLSQDQSQLVHILTFIFALLALIFMAVAYYSYS